MSVRSACLVVVTTVTVGIAGACGGEDKGRSVHDAPVRDPRALEVRVKDALFMAPETTAQRITVESREGEVTLSGVVGSAAEKMAAARVARAVDGVVALDNNLSIRDDAAADAR